MGVSLSCEVTSQPNLKRVVN